MPGPGRPVRRLPPTVKKDAALYLLLDPKSDACRLVEQDVLASARAEYPRWAVYRLTPADDDTEPDGGDGVPPKAS